MESGIKVKIKDSVLTLKNLQTDEVVIENVPVSDLKFENKVFTIVVDENIWVNNFHGGLYLYLE